MLRCWNEKWLRFIMFPHGIVPALFAALVIAIAPSARAATMTVPNDCSLDYAIASADGAENFIGAASISPSSHTVPEASRVSCGGILGDGNDTILLNGNAALSPPDFSGRSTEVDRKLTIKSNTGSCVTITQTAYLTIKPGASLTLQGVGMSSDASRRLSVLDNNGGTLTISGMNGACLFSDNKPAQSGLSTLGGIIHNRNNGQTTIDGAFFDFSSASNKGGAIYLDSGKLNITSNSGFTTTLSSNTADLGGAIYVNRDATLNITSSNFRIENNSAGLAGGAIYNDHGTVNIARGNGAVLNIAIGGNKSRNGGGLFIAGGKLSIGGAEIENNAASEQGGGLYIDDVHPGTISQTYFHENSADEGSAIFDQNDQLNVTASTFDADTGRRGSIVSDSGTLNILNSTLQGPSSPESIVVNGGSRAIAAFLTLNGGTLQNNAGFSEALTEEDSIVSSGSCSSRIFNGVGNISNASPNCPGTNVNPGLGALSRNGGPTPTIAVSKGSSAIGSVSFGDCRVGNTTITTDQRGALRPSAPPNGGPCTTGAYEYNGANVPPDTVPPNAAIPN